MTPTTNAQPFVRRVALTLPQRMALTPEELARRSVRRRLLKYIVETHRSREAARRRGLSAGDA